MKDKAFPFPGNFVEVGPNIPWKGSKASSHNILTSEMDIPNQTSNNTVPKLMKNNLHFW
jgi:hypothetical protein